MATPTLLKQPVKLALIQLATTPSKPTNLAHARSRVLAAASRGAKIVVLPECFNSPYGVSHFGTYAETLHPSPPPEAAAPSYHALSRMARDARCYLVGGSIPERARSGGGGEQLYNTSLTFGPAGELLAAHRKVHLFDVDIPGGIAFRESAALTAGERVTVVELGEYGKIGVAVCYDARFAEMAAVAARRGAFLLVYPGAFNTVTGPLHWELLARARAVDNQVYVAFCSPARDARAEYQAWGHSLVVDPNARVLAEAGIEEEIVEAELSEERIVEVRRGIPVTMQRRFDVYPDVSEGVGVKTGEDVSVIGETVEGKA